MRLKLFCVSVYVFLALVAADATLRQPKANFEK
jgi:hypothetical protein